jgi:hypothetical protein
LPPATIHVSVNTNRARVPNYDIKVLNWLFHLSSKEFDDVQVSRATPRRLANSGETKY